MTLSIPRELIFIILEYVAFQFPPSHNPRDDTSVQPLDRVLQNPDAKLEFTRYRLVSKHWKTVADQFFFRTFSVHFESAKHYTSFSALYATFNRERKRSGSPIDLSALRAFRPASSSWRGRRPTIAYSKEWQHMHLLLLGRYAHLIRYIDCSVRATEIVDNGPGTIPSLISG